MEAEREERERWITREQQKIMDSVNGKLNSSLHLFAVIFTKDSSSVVTLVTRNTCFYLLFFYSVVKNKRKKRSRKCKYGA